MMAEVEIERDGFQLVYRLHWLPPDLATGRPLGRWDPELISAHKGGELTDVPLSTLADVEEQIIDRYRFTGPEDMEG